MLRVTVITGIVHKSDFVYINNVILAFQVTKHDT